MLNCFSKFNVSSRHWVAIYTNAPRPLTAKELRNVVRMVEIDIETMEEAEQRDAQSVFPEGSLEAASRAIRDAMGDMGRPWQDYSAAVIHALCHMPASGIAARSDETAVQSHPAGLEPGPKGDAK